LEQILSWFEFIGNERHSITYHFDDILDEWADYFGRLCEQLEVESVFVTFGGINGVNWEWVFIVEGIWGKDTGNLLDCEFVGRLI